VPNSRPSRILPSSPLRKQYSVRQDDAHAAIGLEAGQHVLGEGEVSIATRRDAVDKAAVGVADLFVVWCLRLLTIFLFGFIGKL
jgi:hypothetical protein